MSPSNDMPDVPRGGPTTSLTGDEPMTDEVCLFVHSLLMDGRTVPGDLESRAKRWAAEHEHCRRAVADFEAIHDVLSTEPSHATGQDFTSRVVRTARSEESASRDGEVLPFVRKLAAAAAIVLSLTLIFEASTPEATVATDDVQSQRYAVDDFRADAFEADDLEAGLEALLPFHGDGGAEPETDEADEGRGDAPSDEAAPEDRR